MIRHSSGNILFIILIAIVLFAMLGSVVMNGNTTTNKISEDKAKLYAQDIISYANTLESAVQTMLSKGVYETDLCFDYDAYPGGNADYEHAGCADEKNRVFSPNGGGVHYMTPASRYLDSSYSGENRYGLYTIGGNTYVDDIPLGASVNSGELILFLPALKKDICEAINNALNLNNATALSAVEAGNSMPLLNTSAFYKGSFGNGTQIGGGTGAYFNGKAKACFQQDPASTIYANGYVAYFVLHAR